VVPASIAWDKASPLTLGRSLCIPREATVSYGAPMIFPSCAHPDRKNIEQVTARIMHAIRALRKY